MNKMNLSTIIITRNEADVIGVCIKSVKNVSDEVIVLDSGSKDDTANIAKKLGAKVYSHNFKNFSDQRNHAASFAKGEWILFLDADEQATEEFNNEIVGIVRGGQSDLRPKNGYFIKRKTFYFDKDWEFMDKVQRLFKREKFKGWKGIVHETPEIEGEFGVIQHPIIHKTHRSLEQMVAKTNDWSEFEADLRLKSHHPKMTARRFIRVMLTAYYHSYIRGKGYKNGTAGVVEAIYQSFSMFITYAKLWEQQMKKEA